MLVEPVGDVIYQVMLLPMEKNRACTWFMGQEFTKLINITLPEVNFDFYTGCLTASI